MTDASRRSTRRPRTAARTVHREEDQAPGQGGGQGSSRRRPEQVQALLFLNQYVEKAGRRAGTAFAQYRALVTVVRTDHGWLVSDIETK